MHGKKSRVPLKKRSQVGETWTKSHGGGGGAPVAGRGLEKPDKDPRSGGEKKERGSPKYDGENENKRRRSW